MGTAIQHPAQDDARPERDEERYSQQIRFISDPQLIRGDEPRADRAIGRATLDIYLLGRVCRTA